MNKLASTASPKSKPASQVLVGVPLLLTNSLIEFIASGLLIFAACGAMRRGA
jgi:hypothetical protein